MKLNLLELILKGIPEAAIFALGIYAFSKTKVNWKNYLFVTLMIFILTYIVRLLPINYGVNMMIVLMFSIFIGIIFLKIPLFQMIKASLANAIAIIVGEGLNSLLLQVVYGSTQTQEIIKDPTLMAIYFIPSTIIFGTIVLIAYYFNVMRVKGNKNVDTDKQDINNHMS